VLSGDLYGLVVGVELTLAISCGVGRLRCARGVWVASVRINM
jgi:hypothetical protein